MQFLFFQLVNIKLSETTNRTTCQTFAYDIFVAFKKKINFWEQLFSLFSCIEPKKTFKTFLSQKTDYGGCGGGSRRKNINWCCGGIKPFETKSMEYGTTCQTRSILFQMMKIKLGNGKWEPRINKWILKRIQVSFSILKN